MKSSNDPEKLTAGTSMMQSPLSASSYSKIFSRTRGSVDSIKMRGSTNEGRREQGGDRVRGRAWWGGGTTYVGHIQAPAKKIQK